MAMRNITRYRAQPLTVNGHPLTRAARRWPERLGQRTPRWCSVDLRDGNQALVEPMDVNRKLALWHELVRVGFTEIEIGFPSASGPELDFCRHLIDNDLIGNTRISVLTQCRDDQLEATFTALRGAGEATVHFYNSTSELQRRVTFGLDRDGIIELATTAARRCRQLEELAEGTTIHYEYSPESFTGTELDYAVHICEAVTEALDLDDSRELVINLPATVEHQPPSMYADAIEWFCEHLPNRDRICVSVHPHNDRGCAVAATEAAIAAGADRVEGTLFGNGERTGNVDIVTVALNLYSWGVDPNLDLSDLPRTRRIVEDATRMDVPARHPYAGDLAWVAFSGSHQDAIAKGLAASAGNPHWEVPYLSIDPADIGRDYEPIIRLNSQSGRGGVTHILAEHSGHRLPRELAVEFTRTVQQHAETDGGELDAADIAALFNDTHLNTADTTVGITVGDYTISEHDSGAELTVDIHIDGRHRNVTGTGNGPVSAYIDALNQTLDDTYTVAGYHEAALEAGTNSSAGAYILVEDTGGNTAWGVGVATSTTRAALDAISRAVTALRTR